MVGSHPEEIEHVGGNHRVAQEECDSSGRQKLIDSPAEKSARKQQPPHERGPRRLETQLQQSETCAGQQERQGAEPSVYVRGDELIRQQQNCRSQQR